MRSVFQMGLIFFSFFCGIIAALEFNESIGEELTHRISTSAPEFLELSTLFFGFPLFLFLLVLLLSYSNTKVYGVFGSVLAAAGGYYILTVLGFFLIVGAIAIGIMTSFVHWDRI